MATLNTCFDDFLTNIEPDPEQKNFAKEAHSTIREHLENDATIAENVIGSFLYGSYKRHTAVGDIKDIDIAILTDFDPSKEENTPAKVLAKLKKSLNEHYEDADNLEYSRKSVKVKQALPEHPDVEMTLDVLPTVVETDGDSKLLIPDKELSKWVYSHPKAHTEYTSNLNSLEKSKEMFVPLVKIFKYWWKLNSKVKKPQPKGFWIEFLVGDNFQAKDTYAELFTSVLESISNKYSNFETLSSIPELKDPGLEGEYLKISMSLDEFKKFMRIVDESLNIAKEALDLQDVVESSKKWNQIFGDQFKVIEDDESIKSYPISMAFHSFISWAVKNFPSDVEQFIEEKGFSVSPNLLKIKLNAIVTQNGNPNPTLLSEVTFFRRSANLEYYIEDNEVISTYDPVQIFWKIRNTGKYAKKLRGQIWEDDGTKIRKEQIAYIGDHYVECYVIKDNIMIARGIIFLKIPQLATFK